ncbi:MAG TPA: DUF5654 family protein [Candidatus Nanoarchaeia archaeon]|nr:DUF5654 family protein [Candidatus Nanoarchaeia archaeon]
MKAEVIEKLSALITAAFGLVAALAWNNAITKIFEKFFGTQSTIYAMLIYALIVTIIAVIATLIIGRASDRAKKVETTKIIEKLREKKTQ